MPCLADYMVCIQMLKLRRVYAYCCFTLAISSAEATLIEIIVKFVNVHAADIYLTHLVIQEACFSGEVYEVLLYRGIVKR